MIFTLLRYACFRRFSRLFAEAIIRLSAATPSFSVLSSSFFAAFRMYMPAARHDTFFAAAFHAARHYAPAVQMLVATCRHAATRAACRLDFICC